MTPEDKDLVLAIAKAIHLKHDLYNRLNFTWELRYRTEANHTIDELCLTIHGDVPDRDQPPSPDGDDAAEIPIIARASWDAQLILMMPTVEAHLWLARKVRDELRNALNHEINELLMIGDYRPFDPHDEKPKLTVAPATSDVVVIEPEPSLPQLIPLGYEPKFLHDRLGEKRRRRRLLRFYGEDP